MDSSKRTQPMKKFSGFLSFGAFLAAWLPTLTQGAEGPPLGPLQVRALTPTVYWVQGGVGNAGFIVGDKGVVVIDATVSEASAKALLAEVAKVTPKPVTTVILTHGDADHVGGLAAFPAGIAIIAHENNKQRMAEAVAAGRSRIPADRLPNRGVTASETVQLEGVRMQLLHWGPAHTAGDLVIYLPAQKVVFTGDIFTLNQPRALIHRGQQGSSQGWLTTAKAILALGAERYVVGHGDVQVGSQRLQALVQLVATEREQIRERVAKGETLAQIQAAVGDPPPDNGAARPEGPRFPPFSEVVYQELTEKK
jgi:cyclase